MNLDEIIKSMQSLQDEVAKTNETIEQLSQTINSMNKELEDTHEKEQDELDAVSDKWAARRSTLTKEIAEATQKKQLIESSSESLSVAVRVIEAQFRIISDSIAKQDVKDAISILREKYDKSEFESRGTDDLCPNDFDEIEQELNLSTEPDDRPYIAESEKTTAA